MLRVCSPKFQSRVSSLGSALLLQSFESEDISSSFSSVNSRLPMIASQVSGCSFGGVITKDWSGLFNLLQLVLEASLGLDTGEMLAVNYLSLLRIHNAFRLDSDAMW